MGRKTGAFQNPEVRIGKHLCRGHVPAPDIATTRQSGDY